MGKKWCQYCHININYTQKDIQQHQTTRNHIQNKHKSIKYQRSQLQKLEKNKNNQNPFLSTANIPKAKKNSQLQRQVNHYRQNVIVDGKSAIHKLIAQKTEGIFGAPIEYPDKQQLVLAENYGQDSDELQMWRIDICEDTGDACFINNVTSAKLYQPPVGYIMSQQQKVQWEELKIACQQLQQDQDRIVNITQWQEMPEEQNYYKIHEVHQSDSPIQPVYHQVNLPATVQNRNLNTNEEPTRRSEWRQELEKQLNNQTISTNEVFDKFISQKMSACKNLKEKNDTLKKLVQNNFEINRNMQQTPVQVGFSEQNFRPRKKIKIVALTEDKDIR